MNKKKHSLLKELKLEWRTLDLACKSVSIIGILLFIHLVCAVFIPALTTQPTINAIFQTSLSSIFGYILGMSIKSKKTSTSSKTSEEKDHSDNTTVTSQTEQEATVLASKLKKPVQYLNQPNQTTTSPTNLDNVVSPLADNKSEINSGEESQKSTTSEGDDTNTIDDANDLNLRVLFAFGICFTSLITLMCYTLIGTTTYPEGISQIGHLVSTTIGFLVSNSTHQH